MYLKQTRSTHTHPHTLPDLLCPPFPLRSSRFHTSSGCVTRRRASRWPRPGCFVSSRRCTGHSSAGRGRRCNFTRTARSRRCSSHLALPGMWPVSFVLVDLLLCPPDVTCHHALLGCLRFLCWVYLLLRLIHCSEWKFCSVSLSPGSTKERNPVHARLSRSDLSPVRAQPDAHNRS